MTAVWLDLLALLFYGPAVVLLHELGHAALARRGGFRLTDFAIGVGKPLWRLELSGGAVVHIDRWVLIGGGCTAIPVSPASARRIWFHAGGLIAQCLLMVALLPLHEVRLVQHILVFNGLVLAHNALPWRVGRFASDGWYILDALAGTGRGSDVLQQRAAIAAMEARAVQVGTPLGTAYARICMAWADVIAGCPERAARLFQEDPPAATLDPWVDALYHHVHAEWDRVQGRPLGALRTVREATVSVELSDIGDAQGLLALAEARALVDLDAPAQALRVLSRTAGIGGAIGWQAAVTLLWASLDSEPDDVELAAWRVIQRAHLTALDPADGAMALWDASEVLEDSGRHGVARAARQAGIDLADRVLTRAPSWARPSLRRRMGAVAGDRGPESVVAER